MACALKLDAFVYPRREMPIVAETTNTTATNINGPKSELPRWFLFVFILSSQYGWKGHPPLGPLWDFSLVFNNLGAIRYTGRH